jgi:hypothetical protein
MPTGKFRQNKKKGLQSINDAVVKALAKFINAKKLVIVDFHNFYRV